MQDSIFTKIIKGEIPANKLYEDERTIVFLDIHPHTPGHTLVVSKKQVEFVWDLDDQDYQALMMTAKKVARHIREKLNAPYVGVKIIGVDVPHAHVHLIPFATTAEYSNHPDMTVEPDFAALDEMAKELAF